MKENPFYHNYVFKKDDIDRAIIKWHDWLWLWMLPTYVQCADGIAFFYKIDLFGRWWVVGYEAYGKEV